MSQLDLILARLGRGSGPPLTPLEVLEALWLSALIARPSSPAVHGGAPAEDTSLPAEDVPEAALSPDEASTDEARPIVDDLPVGLPDLEGSGGGWRPQGIALAGLPQPVDPVGQQSGIARLAMRRARRDALELDLPKTIASSCRTGEPYLAMREASVPSTHVLLLVDGSVTMAPWADRTRRLEQLVRAAVGMGARSVLRMNLSEAPTFEAEGRHVELPRLARNGMDNQVLLWTDGLAPGFPSLGKVFSYLPSTTRIAWVHPWPRTAWHRTPEGRLPLARRTRSATEQPAIPLLVVGADRTGWAAVGALLRGQRPTGLPLVALPAERVPRILRPPAPPQPGDRSAWASHLARVEAQLHPETIRLLGLLAAFPVQRFHVDTLRALAGHAGMDSTGFLLAEALTSGMLHAVERGGSTWLEFRDEEARQRATLFLSYRDLEQVLAFAARSAVTGGGAEGTGAIELDVLAPAAGGSHQAMPTELAVTSHADQTAPAALVGGSLSPRLAPLTVNEVPPAEPVNLAGLSQSLQPAIRLLENDLRASLPPAEAGLRAAWRSEQKAGETGQAFDLWLQGRITQIAVDWVISVVFVRTLEDRGFIEPRIAGPDARGLAAARERRGAFEQMAPHLGAREYLSNVFRELSQRIGLGERFDTREPPRSLRHPSVLTPSSEGSRALLDFFRQVDDATGAPTLTFPGTGTRFFGDLYQNLSATLRARHGLVQTPDFVVNFILEQALDPAIAEFGLSAVRVIDPTCGSGGFLLGAFRDLLSAWQRQEPATPIEELAVRALGQVAGVDINAFAVTIASFRLVIAVMEAAGITRLEHAPPMRPMVFVADSLLQASSDEEWASRTDALLFPDKPHAVAEVLRQRYHAVVGNPPYITEKDALKRDKYRQIYESASRNYALAAPFTERFFNLAVPSGFVGMMNASSWTRREYGKALIETVLPRLDVQKVVDTSGCYLPGYSTPTLLLFGRNREPTERDVVVVLGTLGEAQRPPDPAAGAVWLEIVARHDQPGFVGTHVSVESRIRTELRRHPWMLGGGGTRELSATLEARAPHALQHLAEYLGLGSSSGADDAFVVPRHAAVNAGVPDSYLLDFVGGDAIRDWAVQSTMSAIAPYDDRGALVRLESLGAAIRHFWCLRARILSNNSGMPRTRSEQPDLYWGWQQWKPDTYAAPERIVMPVVSTHNHAALDRSGRVFGRTSSVLVLRSSYGGPDYLGLLGYLNSSTVGFWCRSVMFTKSVGSGPLHHAAPAWNHPVEYAASRLGDLPVPDLGVLRDSLLDLAVAVEATVRQQDELAANKVVALLLADAPTPSALREGRSRAVAQRSSLRRILVSLQEEIDWRVYGIFGLPTATAPSVEAVRVEVAPNDRPFEVRLARGIATDDSASEWFRVHERDAGTDVGGPLADLYEKRLRLLDDPEHGRQLRLLEAPENKRRWCPADDALTFNAAVRSWLLERVVAAFRDQPTPELLSVRQLAVALGRDLAVKAAHELLSEDTGVDLAHLLGDLVDAEGVPFLAGWRYAETGMKKRAAWEETWRLQRLEDQGELEPELKGLGLEAIPAPPRYANHDFRHHYWRLRGPLDVPKERFVTVPDGTIDHATLLIGWAGWDDLQMSQALAALYSRRKSDDGSTRERLMPLLAGVSERVPWLLQWFNEPSAAHGGMRRGEYFQKFVSHEARSLGVAAPDLRNWRPPAAVGSKTSKRSPSNDLGGREEPIDELPAGQMDRALAIGTLRAPYETSNLRELARAVVTPIVGPEGYKPGAVGAFLSCLAALMRAEVETVSAGTRVRTRGELPAHLGALDIHDADVCRALLDFWWTDEPPPPRSPENVSPWQAFVRWLSPLAYEPPPPAHLERVRAAFAVHPNLVRTFRALVAASETPGLSARPVRIALLVRAIGARL